MELNGKLQPTSIFFQMSSCCSIQSERHTEINLNLGVVSLKNALNVAQNSSSDFCNMLVAGKIKFPEYSLT